MNINAQGPHGSSDLRLYDRFLTAVGGSSLAGRRRLSREEQCQQVAEILRDIEQQLAPRSLRNYDVEQLTGYAEDISRFLNATTDDQGLRIPEDVKQMIAKRQPFIATVPAQIKAAIEQLQGLVRLKGLGPIPEQTVEMIIPLLNRRASPRVHTLYEEKLVKRVEWELLEAKRRLNEGKEPYQRYQSRVEEIKHLLTGVRKTSSTCQENLEELMHTYGAISVID